MHGRVCLVTGGNRGIGFAVAAGLLRRGARVILACRSEARAAAAGDALRRATGGDVHVEIVDLASQASIRELARRVDGTQPRLDVLVHNAAVIPGQRLLTPDGIEMQLAVNHLAPFLLTQLLRPMLVRSAPARVITVSSNSHARARIDFGDLQSERGYHRQRVYPATKLANVLFTYELSRRLEGTGVCANAVRPGTINTGLVGDFLGPLGCLRWALALTGTPARGAAPIVRLAADPNLRDVTGKYFDRFRERPSAACTYDRDTQRRLWEESERLTGAPRMYADQNAH